MTEWLDALVLLAREGRQCILVSIVEALGSTPRELGAKMVVTDADTFATIGGGRFEYNCVALARELLQRGVDHKTERFSLGPSLGQCCGGAATVSFDRIVESSDWVDKLSDYHREQQPVVLASVLRTTSGSGFKNRKILIAEHDVVSETKDVSLDKQIVTVSRQLLRAKQGAKSETLTSATGTDVTVFLDPFYPPTFKIVVFGAGHVGKAVVRLLAGLPCQITWVDSRADFFPDDIPANVTRVAASSPEYEVNEAPTGAYFLVMTHSHPLDQAICERILNRNDFGYCGLIGSISKRKKFEKRFRAGGIPAQTYQKLTCPIGVAGISGKLPTEIAIAVAAELLQLHEKSAQVVNEQLLAS